MRMGTSFQRRLLIAGSLGLNAALVLFLDASPAAKLADTNHETSGPVGQSQSPHRESLPPSIASISISEAWTSLNREDLSVLVARLRAASFPPSVTRAILRERLRQRYAPKRQEIIEKLLSHGSQQSAPPHPGMQNRFAKVRAVLRALTQEEDALMKSLLGEDAFHRSPAAAAFHHHSYGILSPQKAALLESLLRDYNELTGHVHRESGGVLLAEDREALTRLEAERRKELVALLTSLELEEFDLRHSPTASHLRNQLACLEVTEYQFRALFRLQRAHEAQHPSSRIISLTPDTTAAERRLITKMKAVLGEPLASEYERRLEPNYRNLSLVVDRFDLPRAAVQQVLDLRMQLEQRCAAIRGDATVTASERARGLAHLVDEAAVDLAAVLGPRGLEAYRQAGGAWLDRLRASSPPQMTAVTPKS